jgi:hypothetical protein
LISFKKFISTYSIVALTVILVRIAGDFENLTAITLMFGVLAFVSFTT